MPVYFTTLRVYWVLRTAFMTSYILPVPPNRKHFVFILVSIICLCSVASLEEEAEGEGVTPSRGDTLIKPIFGG